MNICVIGGAGYIGSHAVKLLVQKGHAVTCIDNLTNGHRAAGDQDAHAVVRFVRRTVFILWWDEWSEAEVRSQRSEIR
jgi:UDP-glucose 4-epimerase